MKLFLDLFLRFTWKPCPVQHFSRLISLKNIENVQPVKVNSRYAEGPQQKKEISVLGRQEALYTLLFSGKLWHDTLLTGS